MMSEVEMFFKEFSPKLGYRVRIRILCDDSNLGISRSQHTPVVYIGRTYQGILIIYNHHFAMNVDDFCNGSLLFYSKTMISET